MPKRPLALRIKVLYGLVDWGGSAASTARNLFWLYFLVTIVGLDPALAGGVVLISKVWDGFNDPLIGMIWAVNCVLLSLAPAGGQNWVLLIVLFTGPIYGASSAVPWAMLADVMDHDEWKSGLRREGSFAGYMVFFRKLASALAIFLVGQVLAASGFREGAGSVVGGDGPASAVLTLRLLIGVVTPIGMTLAALVALRYPLTRTTHGILHSQLAARRIEP